LVNKLKNFTFKILTRWFSGESIDYKQVIAIFLPVLIDQAFVICLNLLNTAMISTSGVAAVSAVNMVDSLNIFLINVFVALATGGTVVVAQYKGSGNEKMVSKSAAGTIGSVFLLALAIGVTIIIFHDQILGLLFGKAAPDVFANAKIYIIGSCASYCGIGTVESVCGALRGIGETRSSLIMSLTMNLSYVFFNFIFINTLHMGIYGMVISINIARYLAAALAILYVVRLGNNLRVQFIDIIKFDFSMLKRIFFIGLPFAAEQMFFNGGKILTQTFIVSLGTYAIDTNAIAGSMAALSQIPANAMSLTIVTVVGQCMGRRDVKDARKFVKSFVTASSISFILMSMIIFPLYYPIVSLFHPPAEIVPDILSILIINAIAQTLLWSAAFITPSALRAAGDSRFTSIMAMLSMWFFRVVMGYVLGIILHLGVNGVWLAMDLEWAVRGIIFMSRFRGKKWYKHHVID